MIVRQAGRSGRRICSAVNRGGAAKGMDIDVMISKPFLN
jgi:hypothetical protein